ncbi:tetratricopeptide repeat protein [Salegentibacter sp. Hel_I_6]|uniref:tetratricopeptide repeat protein n=1 Tax=Salegentibacter sp. Hel_I_6 TaxID=1250278 RepID=UPI0005668130|nr:tetratricopeptide repeat protein [Salegentibacter sp. Hel_I_6]
MRGFSTNILFVIFGLLLIFPVVAQQQDKELEKAKKEAGEFMQEADAALGENDFPKAEAAYRKAIAKDPENSDARYNMGNMYYTRDNAPQATQRYKQAAEIAETKIAKHKANHNLGNAYMNQKRYQEAVEAYKDALRNNPTDDETRYNLALAKKMLEQEQEQDDNQDGGDDENQDDENQDQENQDENQDQENKEEQQDQGEGDNEGDQDNQDQDQEEKEGDQEEQEEQDGEGDQEEQDKEPEEGQPQPQPAQGQLSPEQIQSLLEAMNNEERKVQDKINAEKQKGAKVKSEKDW